MKHRAAGDRTVSNFIFTIVKVGKVKDSVLVVNKTNIQTRDWCLEVKKKMKIFFFPIGHLDYLVYLTLLHLELMSFHDH